MTFHTPEMCHPEGLNREIQAGTRVVESSWKGFRDVGAGLGLREQEIADVERFLDVSRGEMLFGKGVLFVEGDAELYLIPALSQLAGFNFEQLGISICSISGTHFEPYVRLVSAKGLNIPFAVITDGDPSAGGKSHGVARLRRLIKVLTGADLQHRSDGVIRSEGEKQGLFLGSHTFEVDLFNAGRQRSMSAVLKELTKYGAAKQRAEQWRKASTLANPKRFLADVDSIGKGRFAQRLATRVKGTFWPDYVREAVEYLHERVT